MHGWNSCQKRVLASANAGSSSQWGRPSCGDDRHVPPVDCTLCTARVTHPRSHQSVERAFQIALGRVNHQTVQDIVDTSLQSINMDRQRLPLLSLMALTALWCQASAQSPTSDVTQYFFGGTSSGEYTFASAGKQRPCEFCSVCQCCIGSSKSWAFMHKGRLHTKNCSSFASQAHLNDTQPGIHYRVHHYMLALYDS